MLNEDGDPDDQVIIPHTKGGDYTIKVVPEAGVSSTDTYSLTASISGQTTTLAENKPVSDIPNEPYILEVKVPLSPTPGSDIIIPSSPTHDSVIVAPSQEIVNFANSNKLMLDRKVEIINSVNVNGKMYYVVEYTNTIPFASGIEVISEDGTLVLDISIIHSVFSSIGWQEAAVLIDASDITTLEEVLEISSKIDSEISPVRKATNVVIGAVDELLELGVDIPLIGRVSAWDAVVKLFPEIAYIEDKLRILDEYLNKWGDASQSLSQSIPMAIQGLQVVQEGGELNPDLQVEISACVIGMASLEDTTNDCVSVLSDTATIVSQAVSGLEKASDAKYVGKYISPIASKVDDLYDYINNLRKSAQAFSDDLSQQQAKLTKVKDNELLREINAKKW